MRDDCGVDRKMRGTLTAVMSNPAFDIDPLYIIGHMYPCTAGANIPSQTQHVTVHRRK
jgi:hypothetical protein